MQNNGFIVNKGVLKAYIGNPDITELVIPEGVVTIQESIFQEQVGKSLTIKFPSTFLNTSPDAFKKGSVSTLDFSNCEKIKDFSQIVLNGHFSEVILPASLVKIAVDDKNFRIGNIKIADKKNVYEFGDFSHCKNLKELSFKNLYCSAQELVLPETLQSFEQGGLNCQNIKISAKSCLEKLDVHDLNSIVVPARVSDFNAKKVKYVFFAKSALDTNDCACDGYVVENVDIENITFKDEMSDKGIKYFETSRGLVVTDLDNNIAKFSSVPTIYNNKKIIAFSIVNPFEKDNGAYDEKFGAIKTEMKYMVNQNFINGKNLVKPCYDYRGERPLKDYSRKKRILLSLGLGLLAFLIYAAIVVVKKLIIYGGEINTADIYQIIGSVVYGGLGIFVVVAVAFYFITLKKIGVDWRGKNLRTRFKESSVYKQIEEPYRWKAINYIDSEVNKLYKEDEERRRKQAERDAFWDRIHNGTKEEQQRKAIASKLDELNKNLRDSNSSGSYDLYDDYGNRVGRIEKKD